MRAKPLIAGALAGLGLAVVVLGFPIPALANANGFERNCSSEQPGPGCPHTSTTVQAVVFVALFVTALGSLWILSGRPRPRLVRHRDAVAEPVHRQLAAKR